QPTAAVTQEEPVGMRKRINTFGTPEEDARMRDFTINGLFYDIRTFSVIDHVGGQKDLDKGLIRCIGDPRVRFPEDPVRMVRAVRFASRMNFTIEKKTYRGIVRYHREIANAAPSRLLEEIYRLFGFGTGREAFRLLAETKLLRVMLPAVDAYVSSARAGDLSLWDCLEAFDRQELDGAVPREAAILGTLFYPLFDARLRQREGKQLNGSRQQAARDILAEGTRHLQAPRRILDRLVRAFDAQRRFETTARRFSRRRFVMQETFPDALLLREIVLRARGEDIGSLVAWRELRKECLGQHVAADKSSRVSGVAAGVEGERAPRRRSRYRRRRKPVSADQS
ncbi:MAG: CCA tRNA nucleotidyltransferase, partial [Deltaproteobacteria bacterium]|nr:CCA tRNA nucleotidyltransferase [Deltaproteobacteria bacterium]